MQVEIIEQIIHLPIAERVEIIERISRSVREDLKENGEEKDLRRISIEKRREAIRRLRGIGKIEGKEPPTDEEAKEDYYNYLAEKYK